MAAARAQEAQLREAKEKEKDRLAKQLEKDSLKGKHWSEKASPAPATALPRSLPHTPCTFRRLRWCKPRHATQSRAGRARACAHGPVRGAGAKAEPSRACRPLQKLEEMTERDWRILKEDFEIAIKGGQVLIATPRIRAWTEAARSALCSDRCCSRRCTLRCNRRPYPTGRNRQP